MVLAERLAQEACQIEIETLGKPIGKQDQYISAYGGLRFLEFCPNGEVVSTRVELDPAIERRFSESLLLFYTGVTREAASILEEQKHKVSANGADLREIKRMAWQARADLCDGKLEAFGTLLDESWTVKKRLASQISNGKIEEIYQRAKKAGALGGKIAGAGGGGFLLLFCPPEKRESVRGALGDLRELPFQLTRDGTKVIFNHTH
jgi:D-glycero-alpha-D-manno-heptose-7-phosphate kinase